MRSPSLLRRVSKGLWIVSAGLLLSGTKACQTDYDLGSAFSPRPTETPTPTPTDEGGDTETPTPTPEATETVGVTATPTPDLAASIMGELKGIGISNDAGAARRAGAGAVAAGAERPIGGNWLGRSYLDDAKAEADTDKDGYTDQLEGSLGTDPRDEYSQPRPGSSVLMQRFRGVDDDYDGLSNEDEARLKSDPFNADTDGDGVRDGAEAASGSAVLESASIPEDGDRDGLTAEYETNVGTDPRKADSDNDRLSDSIEIAIGANPLNPDTDGDGILDGREYQSGSDPTLKDYKA